MRTGVKLIILLGSVAAMFLFYKVSFYLHIAFFYIVIAMSTSLILESKHPVKLSLAFFLIFWILGFLLTGGGSLGLPTNFDAWIEAIKKLLG